MRAIQQGGVKIDSIKVEDKSLQINKGSVLIAQVGKRKFAKITVN
jgi:tyrosyl-tRNA synthetase